VDKETTSTDDQQPAEGTVSPPRRPRAQVLREIKLALTIGDGLLLDEEREQRGFDPYDNNLGSPGDIWKPRRRD
jgi:hypothetical protein